MQGPALIKSNLPDAKKPGVTEKLCALAGTQFLSLRKNQLGQNALDRRCLDLTFSHPCATGNFVTPTVRARILASEAPLTLRRTRDYR